MFEQLIQTVESNPNLTASLQALLSGIALHAHDAIAEGKEAVNEFADQLDAKVTTLAGAVTANTNASTAAPLPGDIKAAERYANATKPNPGTQTGTERALGASSGTVPDVLKAKAADEGKDPVLAEDVQPDLTTTPPVTEPPTPAPDPAPAANS